ncbi:MAG: GMC family oxidoreductase N-terminal domain-containing protein [Conexibacter sp.]
MPRTAYDAIVVGAGFGGGIAALRLAEAGRSVLVLERGARYPPGSFPRDVRDVDALLWRYPRRRHGLGLYDVRVMSSVAAVVASGVGGGSLIYANIHVRPTAAVFDDPRWPEGTDRSALDPYYDRVAHALGVAPLPTHTAVRKRDVFRAAAERLGREVFDPDEAVSWTAPQDPRREPCKLVAECEFGCQHGAKNSVDLTYLARAEQLGAQVRTHALATHVEPTATGYRVHYRDVPEGRAASVAARRVVLSAGTLGTNEVLLRSRDVTRTLPLLSPRLGHGYSANGDFLGSIQGSTHDLEPWHGPDVTSIARYDDREPRFTLAAPTFNRATMEVLTSLGQGRARLPRALADLLWPLFGRALPVALRHGLLSRPAPRLPWQRRRDPGRTTFLFAIGQDDASGRLHLRRGALDLAWDYAAANRALLARMDEAMAAFGRAYGGSYAPLFTWPLFGRITTVHSLGGCHLAHDPARGVVSSHGEVHRYPGLFVADGSVVPTAIGFHPAMTISALAERTAEHVVASFPAA